MHRFFITDPDKDDKIDSEGKDKRLRKLLPNIITLTSMICGLTAIQMAIGDAWQSAVLLIVAATFLDTLDGALARLLNATSKFGAELDSLADFLSFGIAPATIMYLWILNDAGKVGWIAALVFVIASALRLARFNASLDDRDDKPEWGRYFFTGVPAPVGAGLVLMPLIIYLHIDEDLSAYNTGSPLIGLWTLVIAALMVSRIPTFSSKQIRLPAIGMIPTLAVIGFTLALLVHAPWITLTLMGLLYIALIPISYRLYKSREKRSLHNDSHV
jgi:CDP-diacylglycerol--serine O-phosphatidyltransferase